MGLKEKKVNVIFGRGPLVITKRGVSHDLDPHKVDYDQVIDPVSELEDIIVSDADAEMCLKLGKGLTPEVKSQLIDFLKENLDVFAWNHEDMVGIHLNVMLHRLNIDPNHRPASQKRRPMIIERYVTLKEEVDQR